MRVLPVLPLLFAGCGSETDSRALSAAPWLADVTAESGVRFLHAAEDERGISTPEILGSGAALLDADSDGDLDAYLVNAAPSNGPKGALPPRNAFFEQVAPLVFVDATERSRTGDEGFGMGAAAGDCDADGDLDLFVANVGPDRLFANRGDGIFDDVSSEAGIGGEGWSSSAAFADLDADGDLDLFVARYLELDPARACRDAAGRVEYCGPTDFPGLSDLLYENLGDGRLREASAERGIAAAKRRGLGVLCADLSGDGRLDVFVANDNDPNQLWVQGDDGRLQDLALERGVAYDAGGREEAGMGIACADFDGNGSLDLLLSHLTGEGSTLYVQEPPGHFRDATFELGLMDATLPFTGFGIVAADLDHDGEVEAIQVDGRVTRGPPHESARSLGSLAPYAERGLLLRRDERGIYREAPLLAGALAREALVGRGLCVGDLDRDGDHDLLTTAVGDRARLWRNDAEKRGHALRVRVRDRNGGDALGARVTALAGGRRFVGLVPSGGSYLSSSEAVCHLGIGPLESVDELEIVWPDGEVERFPGTLAAGEITLVRGDGR